MSTHISIYKGNAAQVEARSTAPTVRENPEYLVGSKGNLEDGDWYYNTASNVLAVYIGSAWNFITFSLSS